MLRFHYASTYLTIWHLGPLPGVEQAGATPQVMFVGLSSTATTDVPHKPYRSEIVLIFTALAISDTFKLQTIKSGYINFNDLITTSPQMMVSKVNYPKTVLSQVSGLI